MAVRKKLKGNWYGQPCEEQVACLLDAAGCEQEAVLHRVSAASCYEQVGEYVRAVTLLCAALSAVVSGEYRRPIEQHMARCLIKANAEARRSAPKQIVSRRRQMSPGIAVRE